MRIGIPKEIKPLEARVGLIPEACADFVRSGHEVFLQRGAGEASGYSDEAYSRLGVALLEDAAALYEQAQVIVKVKEPWADEPDMLRRDHLLFCFLHLAANPLLTNQLLESGVTAVAFETVADRGALPILAPMSDIAGRLSVQIGAGLLHSSQQGKGLLLGGLPAAERGSVVILGAGQAGGNAAHMAAAFGAQVTVFERKRERMRQMRAIGDNVTALYPFDASISEALVDADLLIGAVLIPGAKAPCLVSRQQVASMEAGSVIVDISVDQGGCIETTRPTTYEAPTFQAHGVTHFGVTNMPGAVPRSASQALSAAMIPWLRELLSANWSDHPVMSAAINVRGGELLHPALREQYQ
ncbi:MAG TPA: alanine dehydrogenase [Gammaproteobacteria bacterium]|nr:alanine dehydrogenase [Gammaproteobacteria bacterium]